MARYPFRRAPLASFVVAAAVLTLAFPVLGGAALDTGESAAVITSPTCGQTITADVRLETDLACADVTALIVGASKITIDLNGHSISCHGPGAGGSCQCRDADPFDECLGPEPDVGIDVLPGHDRVRIKGVGTISGFDFGVRLIGGSRNEIEDLLISSPVPDTEADRGETAGIHVSSTSCDGKTPTLSVVGNEISHHTTGIAGVDAGCTLVKRNLIVWNSSITRCATGISYEHGVRNTFVGNTLMHNGFGFLCDGGMVLSTAGSTIRRNVAARNDGDGIVVGGSLNEIVRNSSSEHSVFSGLRITGDDNTVSRNVVTDTPGDDIPRRAFSVVGQRNRVKRNMSLRNGIGLYATGGLNEIARNTLLESSLVDAAGEDPTDLWDPNNICETQTTPVPPPGVCNPGEGA
jgi:hypothetical protein